MYVPARIFACVWFVFCFSGCVTIVHLLQLSGTYTYVSTGIVFDGHLLGSIALKCPFLRKLCDRN